MNQDLDVLDSDHYLGINLVIFSSKYRLDCCYWVLISPSYSGEDVVPGISGTGELPTSIFLHVAPSLPAMVPCLTTQGAGLRQS